MADFSPDTDLELSRDLPAPPELIWRCWSEPELFRAWFAPAPLRMTDCTLELTPGGCFETVLALPDEATVTSRGCFLEVVPEQGLVFTDTLLPGFRPAPDPFMTVRITLVPSETGTLYHAHVLHPDADTRAAHLQMGFEADWTAALDQLEELLDTLDAPPLF